MSTDQKSWTKSAPNKTRFTSNSLGEGLTYVRDCWRQLQSGRCLRVYILVETVKPTPYCYKWDSYSNYADEWQRYGWSYSIWMRVVMIIAQKERSVPGLTKTLKPKSKTLMKRMFPKWVKHGYSQYIYKDKSRNVDNCNNVSFNPGWFREMYVRINGQFFHCR